MWSEFRHHYLATLLLITTLPIENAIALPISTDLNQTDNIRSQCIEANQITREGRFSEAEILARDGYLTANNKLGSQDPLTRYCEDVLAKVYFSNGRFIEAADLFADVHEERGKFLGVNNPRTLETKHNLAMSHFYAGHYDLSLKMLIETLEVYSSAREHYSFEDINITKHQIGSLLTHMEEYDLATAYLEATIDERIEKLGKSDLGVRRVLGSLAVLYNRQEKYVESLKLTKPLFDILLKEYGDLHHEILTVLQIIISSSIYTDNQLTYSSTDQLLKHQRRRTLSEQQSSFGGLQRNITVAQSELTPSIALTVATLLHIEDRSFAGLAANAMLWMKGLGGEYDAALRQVAASKGGESAKLVSELQRLWPLMEGFERSDNFHRAKAVQEKISKVELEIATLSPDFAKLLKAPKWEEVRAALPEGTALLEYMTYTPRDFQTGSMEKELHLAGVLLRPGKEAVFRPLGAFDETLETNIRVLVSLDKKGITRQAILNASRAIYKRLAEPFDTMTKNATAVYVSPDDVLHRIPFGLLKTPRGVWGLDQPVHLVPTGRALQMVTQGKNDGRFVAIGGAKYGKLEPSSGAGRGGVFRSSRTITLAAINKTRGGGWGTLAGAQAEVIELSKLFESSKLFTGKVAAPLTGEAATEDAIRSISDPPAILHLATHGGSANEGFSNNPLGGVALGFANVNRAGLKDSGPTENDGLMRGTDIAQLNLHGTRLVTLSACDTGDGVRLRGEGVMSLAHAFRLAGAQNVLMTYWSVDDTATRRFMQEFYTIWLQELETNQNASPHRALRSTKQSWADKGEHPRHWAAFALIENQVGK